MQKVVVRDKCLSCAWGMWDRSHFCMTQNPMWIAASILMRPLSFLLPGSPLDDRGATAFGVCCECEGILSHHHICDFRLLASLANIIMVLPTSLRFVCSVPAATRPAWKPPWLWVLIYYFLRSLLPIANINIFTKKYRLILVPRYIYTRNK
jgi:hypothetical protein